MLDNPAAFAALEFDQVNTLGQVQLLDVFFPFRGFTFQVGDGKSVDVDHLYVEHFVPAIEPQSVGIGYAEFASAGKEFAGVPG